MIGFFFSRLKGSSFARNLSIQGYQITKHKGIRADTKHRSWPEMIKDRGKRERTAENRMKGSERQLTNITGDNYGGDINFDVIRQGKGTEQHKGRDNRSEEARDN